CCARSIPSTTAVRVARLSPFTGGLSRVTMATPSRTSYRAVIPSPSDAVFCSANLPQIARLAASGALFPACGRLVFRAAKLSLRARSGGGHGGQDLTQFLQARRFPQHPIDFGR